jgi:hypothetical protein
VFAAFDHLSDDLNLFLYFFFDFFLCQATNFFERVLKCLELMVEKQLEIAVDYLRFD